jgi:hypothetical protein
MSTIMFKYIMVECPNGCAPQPIVFPSFICHADALPRGVAPVSAGFLMVYDDRLVVPDIGSESLGLSPRPGDLDLLRECLGHPTTHNPLLCTPPQT